MSRDAVELVAAMTTAALGVFAMVGLAVRFVLLPWLKDHLVTPLLERVETIQSDVRVAAGMFDNHIDRSAAEWGRLWMAIEELREAVPPRWWRTRRREDTER